MKETQISQVPISIFYCYSQVDKAYQEKLKTHLATMKREGLISDWHYRDILPGQEWAKEINRHLKTADIILLLVSPEFMASDYCYTVEMETSLQRFDKGDAWIIPIIVRPVDWKHSPLGRLQALPDGARAVSTWGNRDKAFLDIATGIRNVVNDLRKRKSRNIVSLGAGASVAIAPKKPLPKMKNRALNKSLQRRQRNRTMDEVLGEIAQNTTRFVDNNFSIKEIEKRTKGFTGFLLLIFTFIEIFVLPYIMYQWANPTVFLLSSLFFASLFIVGISNKNGIVAYIVTFAFFIIWSFVGVMHIMSYYHVALSPAWLVIIIFLLSGLQSVLFRPKHSRRRLRRII